eukprot:1859574-Rhodomonas_salina.2
MASDSSVNESVRDSSSVASEGEHVFSCDAESDSDSAALARIEANAVGVTRASADVQCDHKHGPKVGLVCTEEVPSIYVQVDEDVEDFDAGAVYEQLFTVEEVWAETKESQFLRKLFAVKEGKRNGYRKPIAVRPARGNALGKPAHRFFVSYTPTYHLQRIGSMLTLGVGAGRTVQRPTSVQECLREARQTDLTCDFLTKLHKYATQRSLSLGQFTVRRSITLASLVSIRNAHFSKRIMQVWHDLLRTEEGRQHLVPVMSAPSQGFGAFYLPVTASTVARVRHNAGKSSTEIHKIFTAFMVDDTWWGITIDTTARTVTVHARSNDCNDQAMDAVRVWLGNYRWRSLCMSQYATTLVTEEGWDCAQWLMQSELGFGAPENAALFARWMAQSIYRDSLGWLPREVAKPIQVALDPAGPTVRGRDRCVPTADNVLLRQLYQEGADGRSLHAWLNSHIDDQMLAAFEEPTDDGSFDFDDHPQGWDPPVVSPALADVRGCRVVSLKSWDL